MQDIDILVVEDESIISMDIQARLKNLGYNVAGAVKSGEATIEFLKTNQVDLVLMDIMLEGKMDGVDTANHIAQYYNIPIIYLTAYADEVTLQRAKTDNTYGYILKPFNDSDLRIALEIGLHRFQTVERDKNDIQTLTMDKNSEQLHTAKDYALKYGKKKIPAWKGDELIVLDTEEVYFLEIDGRNVYIHTTSEMYSMRGSLKDWEEKLSEHNFFRCHKCYLINIEKIHKLVACLDNSYLIKLKDFPDKIPLSRYKVQSLKDIIII